MQIAAAQIAQIINAKIEGDPEVLISGIAKIEEGKAGSLSFLANPKYESYLYTSQSSVVIVNDTLQLQQPVKATLLRVPDAYAAFAFLLEKYDEYTNPNNNKRGIEQPSFIGENATLGKDIYVGAFAYIGSNTVIGDGVKIFPGAYIGDNVSIEDNTIINADVKIYHNCKVGKRVIIHAGVVIGADGFGFVPQADGAYKKVPQLGNVVIEDNVEIGANTTIDRATMGSTIIRKGVKLDNLVQIAHNVEIGEYTVIAAQTGISGSTKIGKHCMIGGQVGIVGHLHIADGVRINAQSGVAKSITNENAAVTGSPAFDYNNSLRSQAIFRKLPEMAQRIDKLEKKISS
jgi:UDP-3-O-[3-hydroxymyristoyl] glucosamine N-acyltransferase